MGREENAKIFRETESVCKADEKLRNAIKYSSSHQKLILETEDFCVPNRNVFTDEADVVVSKKRSFEAASYYKGYKTCVHNFASATTPGGGVVKGSSAQEECLCRCSTLYFNLNSPDMWEGFYMPHRRTQDPVHNDDCIYTPEVTVMKTDTSSPELMQPDDWYSVNVITCAAPNLRLMPSNKMNIGDGNKKVKIPDDELQALHEKRLTRILDIALSEGNEVVILGAFGCGAFENNPEVVARAAKNVIEQYQHAFKVIEFAVYCLPRDDTNYVIFNRMLCN
ncbi:MAG: TIGR02452 family protein [Lachnospiraceae bacterium]|nr:TIGR02452 family protein [Lachnospiraceae bacterium]